MALLLRNGVPVYGTRQCLPSSLLVLVAGPDGGMRIVSVASHAVSALVFSKLAARASVPLAVGFLSY